MHTTTANRERFRETMRYRRRHLSNRRTYLMRLAARQIREKGRIEGATSRKLRYTEEAIHAYNSLAEEAALPAIR
jgi:hypothetical protein